MKMVVRLLILSLLLGSSISTAMDENVLMMRSTQSFPETMLMLQKHLGEYGYTISRVQRVDIGLTSSGFQTDKYRIVFYGKPEEIRKLSRRFPQLIPYLPLKLTIFAEQDETLLVALDPIMLQDVVEDDEFSYILQRWRNDILSIMDEMREY